MPIVIPQDIPAFSVLKEENIFVMNDERAFSQDIRPLEIAILNLMPTKVETETQFMRLLSNSPLQVNVTLVYTESYKSKNTAAAHLERFYKKFDDIKDKHFDGMIITGAPVETMAFEEVAYWEELKKLFGVFPHKKYLEQHDPLLKGIDDVFYVPHSRHTTVYKEDVEKVKDLVVLCEAEGVGLSIAKSRDNRKIFMMGHMEYDRNTLKTEYERDLSKGLPIKPPRNYFADETCTAVNVNWTSAANLLYTNWLNYYVYQVTPFKF